jgi:transcriptional regulator with XRE-family HTH domain
MIGSKLKALRKEKGYSLEYAAEKLGIARQTLSKWESDESLPDISRCKEIAKLYGVSLDLLVLDEGETPDSERTGKYMFAVVNVGEGGIIKLPEKAMQVFGIKAGDQLVVLGDTAKGGGIALVKTDTAVKQ